jgi:hypothetical protein
MVLTLRHQIERLWSQTLYDFGRLGGRDIRRVGLPVLAKTSRSLRGFFAYFCHRGAETTTHSDNGMRLRRVLKAFHTAFR